jgi:hypothetical protein
MPAISLKRAATPTRATTSFSPPVFGAATPTGNTKQDLVTRDFALSEVERMIRDGETVAALGLLRLKGLL